MRKRINYREVKQNDIIRLYDYNVNGYKVFKVIDVNESGIIGLKNCKLKDRDGNIIEKNISYHSLVRQFKALETFDNLYDLDFRTEKILSLTGDTVGFTFISLDKYLNKDINILKGNTFQFINYDIFISILEEIIRGNIDVYEGSTFSLNIEYVSGKKKKFNFIFVNNFCKLKNRNVYEIMKYDRER